MGIYKTLNEYDIT